MKQLDKELKTLLKNALGREPREEVDYYIHKQSRKPLLKFNAVEDIASHLKIDIDQPTILHLDLPKKEVAILVTGRIGDSNEVWSFGESCAYNTQVNYPMAIAEKRGKARVILKLAKIYGQIYSEEEFEEENIFVELSNSLAMASSKEEIDIIAKEIGDNKRLSKEQKAKLRATYKNVVELYKKQQEVMDENITTDSATA